MGGTLIFPVPADAELAQIVFDGENDRLFPVVDLREDRPGYDDPVTVVDADGAEVAPMTVSAPTDPYTQPQSGVTRAVLEDERYVAFPITIENVGDRPYAVDPVHFSVIDTTGRETRESPRNVAESDPGGPVLQPDDQLAPGASAEGLIRFLLPEGAEVVAVVYRSEGDRLVYLAESGVPLPEPQAPPLVVADESVVTPGCEGVVEWAETLNAIFERLEAGTEEPLPDDLSTADPAAVRQAASVARAVAAELAASGPPGIAQAANDAFVELFTRSADMLDALAEAIESGDQTRIDAVEADLEEVLATFEAEVGPVFEELAATCPEIDEVG